MRQFADQLNTPPKYIYVLYYVVLYMQRSPALSSEKGLSISMEVLGGLKRFVVIFGRNPFGFYMVFL